MKLRVARHTTDLKPMIHFYCDVLGLSVLGSFVGHDGYNGIFIGVKDLDWHLEFTTSGEQPEHKADADDALVFYTNSIAELEKLKSKFETHGISPAISKNPYWNVNGITYKDPDDFLIIITTK